MARPKKDASAPAGLTDEQLSAKYPGSFPFPEIAADAPKELRAEINRVRSASYRKAHAALFDFVHGVVESLKTEVSVELEGLTTFAKDAYDFLSAKRPKAGRPSGTKAVRKPLETIAAEFFQNVDNQTDQNGDKTPGLIAGINVYIGLNMDPVRTMGAIKRYNDSADTLVYVTYDSEARVYKVWGTGAFGAAAPVGFVEAGGKLPAPRTPAAV